MGALFGGGPKAPGIGSPPPAAHPPILGSNQIALIGMTAAERARSAEGMGFDNTIKTSPQGITEKPQTSAATLLGQTTKS